MKRYSWIISALIIFILLAAVEMTIISNASTKDTKEKVVYVKVHVDKDAIITEDMLELREISTEAIHPNALRRVDEAVSMRARIDIEADEMLLKAKLISSEDDIIKAEDTSKRLICVELRIDQANAWQLKEDKHVDIIFVPNSVEQGENSPEAAGLIDVVPSKGVKIIKDVRIAGIFDEDAKQTDITEADSIPKYLSFEVTAEQAVFLAYAKNNGKLELSAIPG
jgi:Flp pilus assembly protein CpaB